MKKEHHHATFWLYVDVDIYPALMAILKIYDDVNQRKIIYFISLTVFSRNIARTEAAYVCLSFTECRTV